ncbi:MAG: hypothetical protein AAGE52_11990 [Myxococcota bacterium]
MRTALASVLLAGCIADASQVLVSFDAGDLDPTGLSLVATVYDSEGNVPERFPFVTDAPRALAQRIPVASKGQGRERFEVLAQLMDADRVVATGHAISVVEPRETRYLRVVLDPNERSCSALQTVVDGRCQSVCADATVEPSETTPVECAPDLQERAEGCGECAFSAGNDCVPRPDGLPCGCPGDECVGGACEFASVVTFLSAGADHFCANQQFPCAGFVDDPDSAADFCPPCDRETCTIDRSNQVGCWGRSEDGQWGDLGLSPQVLPIASGRRIGFVALGLGEAHSCVLTWDEVLRCFGREGDPALGEENPLRVDGTLRGWVAVSAGADHTCAAFLPDMVREPRVGEPLDIHCWGSDEQEALGNGLGDDSHRDVGAPILRAEFDEQVWMTGEDDVTCVLLAERAWCWGRSERRALGDIVVPTPEDAGVDGVQQIGVGLDFVCVRTRSEILCRGVNTDGELGRGTTSEAEGEFAPVAVAGPWLDLAVGRRHACALHVTEGVLCWGQNRAGELGPANAVGMRQLIPSPSGVPEMSDLSAGAAATCGVRDGAVLCWGDASIPGVETAPTRVCFPEPVRLAPPP